jgi:hypothetical protein
MSSIGHPSGQTATTTKASRTPAALAGRIPTGVVIALLLLLAVRNVAPVLQQVAATFIALFSHDPQRANRALTVLRTLRGLPDHQQKSGSPPGTILGRDPQSDPQSL